MESPSIMSPLSIFNNSGGILKSTPVIVAFVWAPIYLAKLKSDILTVSKETSKLFTDNFLKNVFVILCKMSSPKYD